MVLKIVIDLAITSLVLLILGDALASAISMGPKCRKGDRHLLLIIVGPTLVPNPLDGYVSQDVQFTVRNGMLYSGRHLCLHVLSNLLVDTPSSRLVGGPCSSWYDAHFSFRSETE